jgi:hypothetical protein
MAAEDIARMIKERFPDAEIRIEDLAGDGNHYARPWSPRPSVASREFSSTRWFMTRLRATWAAFCTRLRLRPRHHNYA